MVRVPLTMSDSVSKISRIRAADVIASCAIARMMPSEETGHTSESIRVMNATSSPGVSAPRPTPIAPNSRTTTTATVGDHLEEGPEPRRQPDLVHRRRVQLAGGRLVLVADVAAPPEGLDHPDRDRGLLGAGRQVALLVLHPARDDDVLLLEAHREPDDGRGGARDDQTERPVHRQQHDGHRGDLEDVDEQEQHPEAEEPPDRRQVRGGPREQLPGLPPAVEAHRQCLQVGVEVAPHRGLDVEHRVGLDPPPPPGEEGLEHAEGEHEQAERQHRVDLAVGDRAVDERLDHQRDRDRHADAGESGRHHDHQRPTVRAEVGPQAPQGVDACGRRVVRIGPERVALRPTRTREAWWSSSVSSTLGRRTDIPRIDNDRVRRPVRGSLRLTVLGHPLGLRASTWCARLGRAARRQQPSDAHHGGALLDGDLEVVGRSHRQAGQPEPLASSRMPAKYCRLSSGRSGVGDMHIRPATCRDECFSAAAMTSGA